jgi:hypothetical protein
MRWNCCLIVDGFVDCTLPLAATVQHRGRWLGLSGVSFGWPAYSLRRGSPSGKTAWDSGVLPTMLSSGTEFCKLTLKRPS